MNTNEYKIKGYVARDKVGTQTNLFLYFMKPKFSEVYEGWDVYDSIAIGLNKDWFPELKHTDESIEVELTIRKA